MWRTLCTRVGSHISLLNLPPLEVGRCRAGATPRDRKKESSRLLKSMRARFCPSCGADRRCPRAETTAYLGTYIPVASRTHVLWAWCLSLSRVSCLAFPFVACRGVAWQAQRNQSRIRAPHTPPSPMHLDQTCPAAPQVQARAQASKRHLMWAESQPTATSPASYNNHHLRSTRSPSFESLVS